VGVFGCSGDLSAVAGAGLRLLGAARAGVSAAGAGGAGGAAEAGRGDVPSESGISVQRAVPAAGVGKPSAPGVRFTLPTGERTVRRALDRRESCGAGNPASRESCGPGILRGRIGREAQSSLLMNGQERLRYGSAEAVSWVAASVAESLF